MKLPFVPWLTVSLRSPWRAKSSVSRPICMLPGRDHTRSSLRRRSWHRLRLWLCLCLETRPKPEG